MRIQNNREEREDISSYHLKKCIVSCKTLIFVYSL